jgi:hypothetical protein
MKSYAYVFLDGLGRGPAQEKDLVRIIAALRKSWSRRRHTCRVILHPNGTPTWRLDAITQCSFSWSVNPRTERRIHASIESVQL